MPRAAKSACQAPGRTNAGDGKYCAQHEHLGRANRLQRDKERGSSHERGYDKRHQRWRVLVLKRDPLCKIAKLCGGFAASTEADHVVPIREGGARLTWRTARARANRVTRGRRR
jgi:5-methylcytosine-specific restriction protein A